MLLRAGLRHSTLGIFEGSPNEKDMESYKVTAAYIPFQRREANQPLEQWMAEMKKTIARMSKDFPHCDSALIFHENYLPDGIDTLPPELFGKPPKPFPAEHEKKFHDYWWDPAIALGKYYREKYPKIKVVIGNSDTSVPLCAELFRRKYPKEYFDYLGVEMPVFWMTPERLTEHGLQGTWLLKQTAQKLGYGDKPVTACFEWICRRDRYFGYKNQAEWYVRDCLMALAYGFHRINPAVLYDVGSSYYHSAYGANGLCRRYPLLTPKPSYVALATLTQVLDGAKYVRFVDTGSDSLYALEFKGRKGWVYALWTVRGTREVSLDYSEDTKFTTLDMMGREKKISTRQKHAPLVVGTGALYIQTPVQLRQVVPGASRFPDELAPAQFKILNALDSPDIWKINKEGTDTTLQNWIGTGAPWNIPGKIKMAAAMDPEQGACLEMKLVEGNEAPSIATEYASFKLKDPIPVAGEPSRCGLWIKGNFRLGIGHPGIR